MGGRIICGLELLLLLRRFTFYRHDNVLRLFSLSLSREYLENLYLNGCVYPSYAEVGCNCLFK
jgi:hypothetical protein